MKSLFRILHKLCSQFAAVLPLIGALALNSLPQTTGKQPDPVTLKQGQILQMKLVKRLTSDRAQAGDDVLLKLSEPLLVEGVTVLPKGSAIHARIRAVKRAAKNCQHGSIDWELEPLTMPGDAKIEIHFLDQFVARARLDQAERDAAKTAAKTGAGENSKKGSSVGGILKGIVAVPVIAIVLPLQIASEGEASCSGGKGREESFWAGKWFFAEIAADAQISVH